MWVTRLLTYWIDKGPPHEGGIYYWLPSGVSCNNRHVGFLLAWNGIGKHNEMSRYFLLSSYHNTKLQQSDKNIGTHTWRKF